MASKITIVNLLKNHFVLRICFFSVSLSLGDKDGSKVTTVVATPGQGPDRPQEVSYTDTKVIGNGSFGVVYQAKLCDSGELVAIKKVLQDKRFKVNRAHTFRYLSTYSAFSLVNDRKETKWRNAAHSL